MTCDNYASYHKNVTPILNPTKLLLAHFANSVQIFLFRKINYTLFVSQTADVHFTKYRFPFHLANYSKPFTDCFDPEVIKFLSSDVSKKLHYFKK